jgi:hypothetical protein
VLYFRNAGRGVVTRIWACIVFSIWYTRDVEVCLETLQFDLVGRCFYMLYFRHIESGILTSNNMGMYIGISIWMDTMDVKKVV